jgi:hypothetical protein
VKRKLAFVCLLAFSLTLTLYQRAAAHGHTEVGDYELVIGFHNEPAYQGEPNGLDLFVTNLTTEERVNGLEETLRVEVIFGASTKELQVEPQFGQEGAYTAHILPTEAGDYTWHIFGDIEGTAVDVSMTSGPDTFSAVEPKTSVSFPGAEASTGEIVTKAASAAQTALIVGGIGAALGLIGLVLGVLGLRAARRQSA